MELSLEQALQKGIEAHKGGKVQEADRYYTAVLKANPKHPDANHNMGVLAVGVGKVEAALPFFKTALETNPNVAQFWLSYIDALIKLERIADAKAVLDQAKSKGAQGDGFEKLEKQLGASPSKKSTAQEPPEEQLRSLINLYTQGQYKEALDQASKLLKQFSSSIHLHNIIGAANKGLGNLEEAIQAYKKALSINPYYAEAYNNLGNALKETGNLEEAIEAFKKAISLKPDFTEAYNNLGIALKDQGSLEEALEACKKAISLKPDYAEAYNNLGIALKEQGKLGKAIEAYEKALSIKPEYTEAWNNIYTPLKATKLQSKFDQILNLLNSEDITSKNAKIELGILNYKLHRGQENEERYLDQALRSLSAADNIVIKNPQFEDVLSDQIHHLPDKMVALVHFGRSGTGLLHSLIDGHSEVSTLPSIYLSEYFAHSTWIKIISDGWDGMIDRFVSIYDVLFDASSTVPVEAKSKELKYNIGIKEGMANVGNERNELLQVSRQLFRSELKSLLKCYNEIDAFVFFKLVHVAHDRAIYDSRSKKLIFYHVHNPDAEAQLNFIRFNPNVNWIVQVRDPIQSCESWITGAFSEGDYFGVINRILTMLFEIDNVVYRDKSIAIRLEDIKTKPLETIPALCDWMGIEDVESMYQMTAQGKKWWGDPSSPDYLKDGMDPFGKTSIERKIGSIFSENDQFILSTLFYPFSTRFGYMEENEEQFQNDLQQIRPMIDEMFGFEHKIVSRMRMTFREFMNSGSYMYFRSGLIDRWSTLNEFHTYPNMIKPLKN